MAIFNEGFIRDYIKKRVRISSAPQTLKGKYTTEYDEHPVGDSFKTADYDLFNTPKEAVQWLVDACYNGEFKGSSVTIAKKHEKEINSRKIYVYKVDGAIAEKGNNVSDIKATVVSSEFSGTISEALSKYGFKVNNLDTEAAEKARAVEFDKVTKIAKAVVKDARNKYGSKYPELTVEVLDATYYKEAEGYGHNDYEEYIEGGKYGKTIAVVQGELTARDHSDQEVEDYIFLQMKAKVKQDSSITGKLDSDGCKADWFIDYKSGVKN